ncbi:hypothetical protein [Scandinavium hiltneri]
MGYGDVKFFTALGTWMAPAASADNNRDGFRAAFCLLRSEESLAQARY